MARSTAQNAQRTQSQEGHVNATASISIQSLQDLALAEEVERALKATGYQALCAVKVAVQARQVTLRGQVPSYYLKQVAQTVVLAVAGILEVRNDLEVTKRH